MKLAARDLPGFARRPDPKVAALLLYGEDAMRVALKRQDLVAALAGPTAEEEMRLSRLSGGEMRRDPAQVSDALKAQGFFPGPRVVVLEDATDPAAKALTSALEQWQSGDALLVVTAGRLGPRSALRKLFEGHAAALSVPVYNDPPGRAEVEETLKKAGVGQLDRNAEADVFALAQGLDPGDFRQFAEKLALYSLSTQGPVKPEDVAAVAPATMEADFDELVHAVAEARTPDVAITLRKLQGQGESPVRVCIVALQYFRRLLAAASDPKGVSSGIARLRPPVFGPMRDRLARQVQAWRPSQLEAALHILTDTDLALRSTHQAPDMAMVERALFRITALNASR